MPAILCAPRITITVTSIDGSGSVTPGGSYPLSPGGSKTVIGTYTGNVIGITASSEEGNKTIGFSEGSFYTSISDLIDTTPCLVTFTAASAYGNTSVSFYLYIYQV